MWVSWSTPAATTEYHRLGGLLTTDLFFLPFWRLEVQGQGTSMVRLLPADVSLCPYIMEAGRAFSQVSLVKALIPFMRASPS